MKGKVDASSLKNMVLHSYIVCGLQLSKFFFLYYIHCRIAVVWLNSVGCGNDKRLTKRAQFRVNDRKFTCKNYTFYVNSFIGFL